MSICKLSFAKSRSVADPARGTEASEIPRNEAYVEVRRNASGPEGQGMRVTQQVDVFRQPPTQPFLLLPDTPAERFHRQPDHRHPRDLFQIGNPLTHYYIRESATGPFSQTRVP